MDTTASVSGAIGVAALTPVTSPQTQSGTRETESAPKEVEHRRPPPPPPPPPQGRTADSAQRSGEISAEARLSLFTAIDTGDADDSTRATEATTAEDADADATAQNLADAQKAQEAEAKKNDDTAGAVASTAPSSADKRSAAVAEAQRQAALAEHGTDTTRSNGPFPTSPAEEAALSLVL